MSIAIARLAPSEIAERTDADIRWLKAAFASCTPRRRLRRTELKNRHPGISEGRKTADRFGLPF